jgi:hypothetical protein
MNRSITFARADVPHAAVPKTVAHRCPALLEMARLRPCLILLPDLCGHDSAGVVACHSNQSEHGKAGARKADDEYSVWGCRACHYWLDQGPATKAEKQATFASAHRRQIAHWGRIATDVSEPARYRKAAQWALNHLTRA